MAVVSAWESATALAQYRATMYRIAAWWEAADCFDKPSLQRADIRAADRQVQAAWQRQDSPALAEALARWEAAITGRKE